MGNWAFFNKLMTFLSPERRISIMPFESTIEATTVNSES